MKKYLILLVAFLAVACNCEEKTITQKSFVGEIISDGYIECFSDEVNINSDVLYTCEPSTISRFGNEIFIGNDKVFPDSLSSVFSINFDSTFECSTKEYYKNSLFLMVHKYESSTVLLDSSFVLMSGSFSYHETHPKEGIYHNTAIFFNDLTGDGGVLNLKGGDTLNSFALKEKLRQALVSDSFPEGPNYLKIEGLAAIPGNKLLFGVREFGNEYNDFSYTISLIEVSYSVNDNKIELNPDVKKIYEYKPSLDLGIKLPIGLSSIEYNTKDSVLYVVTSYENGETTKDIDSYIWYISLNDMYANKSLNLIKNAQNEPLSFGHKIESLTFTKNNDLLLVADDDRVSGENETNPVFNRKQNQFYWCLVKIK